MSFPNNNQHLNISCIPKRLRLLDGWFLPFSPIGQLIFSDILGHSVPGATFLYVNSSSAWLCIGAQNIHKQWISLTFVLYNIDTHRMKCLYRLPLPYGHGCMLTSCGTCPDTHETESPFQEGPGPFYLKVRTY